MTSIEQRHLDAARAMAHRDFKNDPNKTWAEHWHVFVRKYEAGWDSKEGLGIFENVYMMAYLEAQGVIDFVPIAH